MKVENELKGIITDIHRTSLVDGPGIRTTVFMKGCSLRCIWCHNPETQHMHIEDNYGREVGVEEIVAECEKDRIYYDESGGGVTLSGGEPLMQANFVIELLTRLKATDIHTAIDTSGHAEKSVLEKTLGVTDLFLFDYKVTDPIQHLKLTRSVKKTSMESLDYLVSNKARVILRCPIIPGVNDNEEHLTAIAGMEDKYPSLLQIELLPWHTMGNAKYERLGRTVDSRLPKENVSNEKIEFYRAFFERKGNIKVVVKD